MKNRIIIAAVLLACSHTVHAQQKDADTALSVILKNTDITGLRMTSEEVRTYAFLLRDVKKVLPYVNKITAMYQDATARFGSNGANTKAKRKYMNGQEEALRDEYKSKLKDLSIDQGRLLNRLISRQTGTTTYKLLKEYENGFTAFKWNALSSFYNYDLKKMYDPAESPMLESIMAKLGYPLPAFFTPDAKPDAGL